MLKLSIYAFPHWQLMLKTMFFNAKCRDMYVERHVQYQCFNSLESLNHQTPLNSLVISYNVIAYGLINSVVIYVSHVLTLRTLRLFSVILHFLSVPLNLCNSKKYITQFLNAICARHS